MELIDFLNDIKGTDLGFEGACFTWTDRQEGDQRIMAILDRGIANQKWVEANPYASVKHLYHPGSDHIALFLEIEKKFFKKSMRFRFDNRWSSNEECSDLINKSWQENKNGRLSGLLWARNFKNSLTTY
ncbi:hypothetical protein Scep_009881 [Stephania cephalantha]|uniref:Uncharacterized protein n=1 Tax=Stephania cephalantha TaxID=152367 RepID=A0AAP0PGK4_9MAGN